MNNIYDLIIIGAGPAGITASIYAARKKMDFVVITKNIGGQTILSSGIENYPGYQFITGVELIEKFKQHMESFNIQVKENETVISVEKENELVKIETNKETYYSKTTIICSGRVARKLNVKGEQEFKNKGVVYCATCDAPFFLDKDVAVIGGGNSALDAVLQLIKIARKIYLIDIASNLKADPIMVQKAINSNIVEILNNTKVEEIYGSKFVEGIKILKDNKIKDLKVEGVFIEIGSIPSSDFVKDVFKNEDKEIIVNCKCETNIFGIFAAGDVTNVPSKQVIVACGEGAKAAISAFEYLSKKT